eukprot:gene12633-biopygen14038
MAGAPGRELSEMPGAVAARPRHRRGAGRAAARWGAVAGHPLHDDPPALPLRLAAVCVCVCGWGGWGHAVNERGSAAREEREKRGSAPDQHQQHVSGYPFTARSLSATGRQTVYMNLF